jgi:hypothetical protein
MGCIIKYKGQSIPEEQFLQYLNKQITINNLFNENESLANSVYEAAGIPKVRLYRVYNSSAKGVVIEGQEKYTGQWFTTDLNYALSYVEKNKKVIKGQNVLDNKYDYSDLKVDVVELNPSEAKKYLLSQETVLKEKLDAEPDNFIIPSTITRSATINIGKEIGISNKVIKSFLPSEKDVFKKNIPLPTTSKFENLLQLEQQAQQLYSQYLSTIFPNSKVEEMDNSLYISVLNQLEQENKIEKDCTGGGKLKAKDGITTLFEKGGKWELVTDFKNAPTHKAGGKDISIQGKKVEIEKNELRIENDFGDVAVIPSKYRVEVKDAIKSNCHSCIDNIVESLPKMKDYAGYGTVFPFFGRYKRFKNSLPDNLKNTSEDDYAMRYYWKHNNKPKSFDEAINRERPMFTMEDDGYYHSPSVEPNTLRFLKPKNHPTLQYELDWYNSDNPDAVDFKSKYDLDTSGKFYKYVPKRNDYVSN